MSIHILCLTSGGGLPIFTKKKGEDDNLPYSVVGSLNGVHMFSKSHNIEILNTQTSDHNITWKEFYDSVVLIGICTGSIVTVLNSLLESIFDAMVLTVGLDEIKAMKNVERLKRDLRPCYPIIDRLINSVDYGDASKNFTDLVLMSEVILCSENHLLQPILDNFAEELDTHFACILIHGKIAVATENWWLLHPNERKLLSILGSLEHNSTAKENYVYLPYKSSTVASRLVSCTLVADVTICCLLGPDPPLEQVEQNSCQIFKGHMETLRLAAEVHPRNFSSAIQLDTGILGLLLINLETKKYMLSKMPHGKKSTGSGSTFLDRLDSLRTFFYQNWVDKILDKNSEEETNSVEDSEVQEIFWKSEYHRVHSLKTDNFLAIVLYQATLSLMATRKITQEIVKLFNNDKNIFWS